MAAHTFTSLLFLLIPIIITFTTNITAWPVTPTIGVTINHYPATITPERLVAIVKCHKITAVRLIDPNPNIIRAFSNSSVSLLITIPDTLVPSLSTNPSNAAVWVDSHVAPFYPSATITAISVGFTATIDHLPAIRNIYGALHELGIRQIQVSTTFSLNSILTSEGVFPPSLAQLAEPTHQLVIKPIMNFLQETNSSLMVSLYPYHLYQLYPEISIGFALFENSPLNFRDDHHIQARYRNLFDTMVDAVQSAMRAAMYYDIPIIVAETGWPWSPGDEFDNDEDDKLEYAELYMRGLIDHLKFDIGTPLYSNVPQVYIYELFDREISVGQGNGSGLPAPKREREWGVLYPNSTSKYRKLDFNGGNSRVIVRINAFLGILLLGIVIAIL